MQHHELVTVSRQHAKPQLQSMQRDSRNVVKVTQLCKLAECLRKVEADGGVVVGDDMQEACPAAPGACRCQHQAQHLSGHAAPASALRHSQREDVHDLYMPDLVSSCGSVI